MRINRDKVKFRENKSHIVSQGVEFKNVAPEPGTVLQLINIGLSECIFLGLREADCKTEGPYKNFGITYLVTYLR